MSIDARLEELKRDLADSIKKHGQNSAEAEGALYLYAGYLRKRNRGLEAVPLYGRQLGSQMARRSSRSGLAETCGDIGKTLEQSGRPVQALEWYRLEHEFKKR